MKTLDIANQAIAGLGVGSPALAVKWASNRFAELAGQGKLRPFRKLYEVQLPANITAGTITTTRDSTTVTGNATAAAAWPPSIVGKFFRATSNWYEIASVSGTIIKLVKPFSEDAVSAGTYHIVPRKVELEKNIRFLGTLVNMRTGREVKHVPLDDLDRIAAARTTVTGGPTIYSEVSVSDEGVREIELYPYHSSTELIRYTAYVDPPELKPDSLIPSYLNPYILIEGVRIDIMRQKMAAALDAGQVDVGATWANLYRSQETKWRELKNEFQKQAEAVNDAEFILELGGSGVANIGDVRNARDYYLNDYTSLT